MSPENADVVRRAADAVQWVNLALAVGILAVSLEFGRRWAWARPYLLGPVSIGAHSVAFYLVALLARMPGPVASLWSAVLRLHIYLVIAALLAAAFAVALSPAPPGVYGYGDEADDE